MVEDQKPKKHQLRLQAAPKVRGLYWCDFWQDAQLPEMWKTRPVIIISHKHTLYSPCLVVPTSTDPQAGNKWAHKLSVTFEGVQSWVVCNQPSTVAATRLSQFKGHIPIVPQADFDAILGLLLAWIPKPRNPAAN